MNRSEQINELATALAKAQAEMRNPQKDGKNPWGSFATLAAVRDAVLPVLSKHGLAVIQSAGSGEKGPTLTTLLLHASGQYVETDALCLPAVKQDAQAFGSAISYARRYSLMALAGVVGDDDDDGAAASKPVPAKAASKEQGNGKGKAGKHPPPPADGAELQTRLLAFEARLVEKDLCQPGDLLTHIRDHGVVAGYVPEIVRWSAPAIKWAMGEARAFEQRCKADLGPVHAGKGETS